MWSGTQKGKGEKRSEVKKEENISGFHESPSEKPAYVGSDKIIWKWFWLPTLSFAKITMEIFFSTNQS